MQTRVQELVKTEISKFEELVKELNQRDSESVLTVKAQRKLQEINQAKTYDQLLDVIKEDVTERDAFGGSKLQNFFTTMIFWIAKTGWEPSADEGLGKTGHLPIEYFAIMLDFYIKIVVHTNQAERFHIGTFLENNDNFKSLQKFCREEQDRYGFGKNDIVDENKCLGFKIEEAKSFAAVYELIEQYNFKYYKKPPTSSFTLFPDPTPSEHVENFKKELEKQAKKLHYATSVEPTTTAFKPSSLRTTND